MVPQSARLVGGRSDADGAWAYGRLEIFNGAFYTSLSTGARSGQDQLGRKGADPVCRSLGFATGAQFLTGGSSGLPGFDGTAATNAAIVCNGTVATLEDCTTYQRNNEYRNENLGEEDAVALLCYSPSGVDVSLAHACNNICLFTSTTPACCVWNMVTDITGAMCCQNTYL